ncbi:hypothetical protein AWRI1631_30790 [Saccharomyces cerevisiae AWRI1631]|uniref:Uncharacterized protein n=1 Tax=Saccharomyces cerevisiae (strain AWRI1631) TaxID=545124 RepID=B5VEW8_YEAS6|nr:hypothetical protein AWRI1631_30790 [Saccharomyces cerevisiae AWRI1631]
MRLLKQKKLFQRAQEHLERLQSTNPNLKQSKLSKILLRAA